MTPQDIHAALQDPNSIVSKDFFGRMLSLEFEEFMQKVVYPALERERHEHENSLTLAGVPLENPVHHDYETNSHGRRLENQTIALYDIKNLMKDIEKLLDKRHKIETEWNVKRLSHVKEHYSAALVKLDTRIETLRKEQPDNPEVKVLLAEAGKTEKLISDITLAMSNLQKPNNKNDLLQQLLRVDESLQDTKIFRLADPENGHINEQKFNQDLKDIDNKYESQIRDLDREILEKRDALKDKMQDYCTNYSKESPLIKAVQRFEESAKVADIKHNVRNQQDNSIERPQNNQFDRDQPKQSYKI